MAEHTPGPWKAERRNWRNKPVEHDIYITGNEHECYEEDDDGTEMPVGTVATSVAIVVGNRTSESITQANAKLITAAPQLLGICELLVEPLDEYQFTSLVTLAKQVIAKAKGLS